ncbi:2-keto-4-pentenoate hydratase/2-oxohepta-3-ene-1,7-dioic acid hydratase in catechol pathway [Thermocatellispora tengchongensis]|uniref:2-keto-4-pentenoate hydratase/2-oxohepta-3-ene-1,7-dioic acid hydratase in catechol pathway n=1 Tax=Thermocatellispora tengchongensis TaxID=1073253 RepID=A0A840PEI4_9ACTN|nr:fumarylacetoacetate hydrolase family protein [Thermocatellispora tengchongensis]MBB5139834.1 2-keto-4-pentenoate hydratase/2-oxohepta-3-ene-1,7-dioic acid hydratase in catechol pathway [Thermocatellispora tengchongensis]
MRLARFRHQGRESLGAVHGDGVIPLPWPDFDTLFGLEDPAAAVRAHTPDPARAVIPDRLLAPVRDRAQIIGTGGNYADHVAEAASASLVVTEPVFIPFLWGAVIGPEDDIVIPFPDTQTDYEVELAVVIGRTARRLTADDAMDHVFGYTVVNDVSAREVMAREKMQVMLSKSPDTFLPVGPHVVTIEEIADPYDLGIATYLNGEVRQKSRTAAMTHRIPDLLVRITRHCTLHPGDIVTTGTPGGVGFGRDPQEFMRPGDTIVAEVEGVGRLTNRLVAGW